MNVNLSSSTIEQLARCTPGVIEKVLHQIKTKIERKEEGKYTGNVYFMDGLSADASGKLHRAITNLSLVIYFPFKDQ